MPGGASGEPISAFDAKYKIVKGKDGRYCVYVKCFFWFWMPLTRYGHGGAKSTLYFTHYSDAQMVMEAHRLAEKEKREETARKIEVEYFY
jgi:hypothetical protein